MMVTRSSWLTCGHHAIETVEIVVAEGAVLEDVVVGVDAAEEGVFVGPFDDEDRFDFLVVVQHLLVAGQQGIGLDDHEGAAGVVEDVLEFLGRGFAAARHADGAERHERQVGDDPGVAVVGEQQDLAAPASTLRSSKALARRMTSSRSLA